MTLGSLLRRFLRPYAGLVATVVVLLALQAGVNLYLPNLNADIINEGVITGNLGYIVRTGIVMIALALGMGLIAVMAVYLSSRVSMGAGADLRSAVFRQVQQFSARELSSFGISSLVIRNTNDVQQIQIFVQMALTLMVTAPIMSVGGIVMAIREGASLSALLGVSIPLLGIVVGLVLILVVPQFRAMQVKIDRINQVLREQISGVRVIRAFVRSSFEEDRFGAANADLTATALRVNRVFALTMPTVMVILNLSSVAVLWFGGHLVNTGAIPIGNLTAFLTYIAQILISVMMAVMIAILAPRAIASGERIGAVLETMPSITDPPRARRPAVRSGAVAFERVGFHYSGSEQPVLSDISCRIDTGTTTGIIGGTGSGKSTLLQLIPRFLDVSSGRVLLDGIDVREQELEDLWRSIGWVPQSAFLFRGTVAENLRVGREEATEAQLWRALEIAQAADFVAAMPGSLEAPIDQGGTNVSGGQRQRLAIARALVKRPALYLFDDCFSALDAVTDARLRGAMAEVTVGSSVAIVAQRVSTIMSADNIIVLDEGTVVGSGTHRHLIAHCPAYREIALSQLGEAAVT